MASDPKRIGQALEHIRRIKAGDYPVIMGNSAEAGGGYRIEERPFQELPEPSQLAILQEAVDWSGITNRDQGHILLGEIDPGKITDAQRSRLIDLAAGQRSYGEMLREASGRSGVPQDHDRDIGR